MTKREFFIAEAKVAGYHDDKRTFTRLLVSSRVRREILNQAWHDGRRAYANGVSCTHCERQRSYLR